MRKTTERLGAGLRDRRRASRIGHLDEENRRLRTELGSARSLLEREREGRLKFLDVLKAQPKAVVRKKRGGLLRSVIVGGGAYLLGSRAGRERYNEIVGWARGMRDRAKETAHISETRMAPLNDRKETAHAYLS